jgi:hypothetical protein
LVKAGMLGITSSLLEEARRTMIEEKRNWKKMRENARKVRKK